MKTTIIILSILSISILACSKNDENFINTEELTKTEIHDLIFLREEEKLARDVYLYAYEMYKQQIFYNISQSEKSHMDSLLNLLNIYNLEDPVINERGKFSNMELQQLYSELTAQVDFSLVEALKVGATIEDLDINDINQFEKHTEEVDILNAYGKLKCGSRNHLRNFTNQLAQNSINYVPQFIALEDYNEIINSGNEKCGSN